MRITIAAAFALTAASALHAQTAAPAPNGDLGYATPSAGTWSYAAVADGTEASFRTASALPQLTIKCTRSTRRVTISKPATGAAPFLLVWTDSLTRNLPASFNPATARISAELAVTDPLLDAISFSRGRFAVGVSGAPTLVVPAWTEAARVIEDCRV